MLFYEEGKLSNGGLFYECIVPGGKPGIFTFLRGLVVAEGKMIHVDHVDS